MPFRLVVFGAVVTLLLVPGGASGQNGQGANLNPAATPPVRPPSLTPTTSPRPVLILQTEPGRVVDANLFGGLSLLRFGQLGQAPTPPEPVFTLGNGVTAPRAIVRVEPNYPSAAMRQKIEGAVVLEAVVQTDGRLQDIKVVKSLDKQYGLDQAALDAATKWLFEPGTKDGKPVSVRVTLEMRFAIEPQSKTPASFNGQTTPSAEPPAAAQASDEEFMKGAHKATEAGITSPKVKEGVEASYTPAAMQAKIQGIVRVEMVVLEDGTVARARVVESLDKTFGLDENALAAALKTTFEPGTLNGQAVPVVATMTLEFRLH
jgi:TonB family protein